MKRSILILFLLMSITASVMAQKITPEQYIEQYKDLAIREMKRMGVPAAVTLAQGLLETESGNSDLLKKSNNHFGIKCKSSWTAEGVRHDDDAAGECFRQYKTSEDSYRDHSNFLRGNQRYAFLFNLKADDYKGWAYGLKKAGYATNPAYPQILIKNIEQYDLNKYTLSALDEVPVYDGGKYQPDPEEKAPPVIATIPSSETNEMVKQADNRIEANNETGYPEGVFKINGKKVVYGKKGTSLLKIADEHNIRLVKLLEYNDLKEDGLLEDDRLVYLESKPADAVTIVAVPVNKQAATPVAKKHIVQPKEGLYAISKKYGVTVQQLKDWNNLQGDALSIGQELIVGK